MKTLTKNTLHRAALIGIATLLPLAVVAGPAPKNKMSTPTVAGAGSTQGTLDVQVTAGVTGAPAGFSLQWVPAAGFTGWPASDSPGLCKASFSGNASGYYYNLGSNESMVVTIGQQLLENGASTNCASLLTCGTSYTVRSFAHADSKRQRSDFSADVTLTTESCGGTNTTCRNPVTFQAACTNTQGFWGTHGPLPKGNNVNNWLAAGLTLGTVSYTDLELQAILDANVSGNGLTSLAHQLIAAKLNVAGGSISESIASTIAAADALIGSLIVGIDALPSSATAELTGALAAYNEGVTGPGHCESYCQAQ
jgi:hypothetical protein